MSKSSTSAASSTPKKGSPRRAPSIRKSQVPLEKLIIFGKGPDEFDRKLGERTQATILRDLPIQGNPKGIDRIVAKEPRQVRRFQLERKLDEVLEKAKIAASAEHLAEAEKWVKDVKDGLDDEEANKERADLIAAAREGDREAKAALSTKIIETGGYLIRATSNWMQAYRTIKLEAAEIPWVRGHVPMEVDVKVGTADGGMEVRHASRVLDHRQVDLFFLITDKFVVNLFDPYHGNIRDAQMATVDLAFDLSAKLDGLLQLPLTVGTPNSILTANFVLDDTTAANYYAHSRIAAGNLPTGNIITLSTNGASTKPRMDVLRAIIGYMTQWGSGAFQQGDLSVEGIRVASSLAASFLDEFSAASPVNVYSQGVVNQPFLISYGGQVFRIIPDNTIDPADKHVYVQFNLKPGLFFTKPAGGLTHSEVHEEKNEEVTWQRSLQGILMPADCVPFWLAVKFKS